MATAATRADLKKLETKLENLVTELKAELDTKATKADLERFATKADLDTLSTVLIMRMDELLIRHARGSTEHLTNQIAAVDQKYADIPARVTRLEEGVEPSRRRR